MERESAINGRIPFQGRKKCTATILLCQRNFSICNYSDQNIINIYIQNAIIKKIRRKITHGRFGEVYFVSSFPQYDVEYITYPSVFEPITEIAKRNQVVIIPTGTTAANRLGFSTQVPMNTNFLERKETIMCKLRFSMWITTRIYLPIFNLYPMKS